MCTTGRWPLYWVTAVLMADWICAFVAPAGTSTTGRCRLGSTPGSVGSGGLIVLRLTIEESISSRRPGVTLIGLAAVKILPRAMASEPVPHEYALTLTTGPVVTVLNERMTLSYMRT